MTELERELRLYGRTEARRMMRRNIRGEVSRWRFSGLSPEQVLDAIEANSRHDEEVKGLLRLERRLPLAWEAKAFQEVESLCEELFEAHWTAYSFILRRVRDRLPDGFLAQCYDHGGRWQTFSLFDLGVNDSRPLAVKSLHQLHRSEVDPEQVAFTKSFTDLWRDKQTRMPLNRFLSNYGLVTDSQEMKRVLARFAGRDYQLRFGSSEAWVDAVYLHGPSSCMKYGDGNRPFRCYAETGLQLAALLKPADPSVPLPDSEAELVELIEAGQVAVAGRALCCGSSYVRIYPDPEEYREGGMLEDLLRRQDYDRDQRCLEGQLLRTWQVGEDKEGDEVDSELSWIIPYLDGRAQAAELIEQDGLHYWRVCESLPTNARGISGPTQSGCAYLPHPKACGICGEQHYHGEVLLLDGEVNSVCPACLHADRAVYGVWGFGRMRDASNDCRLGWMQSEYLPADQVVICDAVGGRNLHRNLYAILHDEDGTFRGDDPSFVRACNAVLEVASSGDIRAWDDFTWVERWLEDRAARVEPEPEPADLFSLAA